MVKPNAMSWKIQRYDDYKIPLIQTDLEKLTIPEDSKIKSMDGTCLQVGKHKAVTLQMTLSPSCYATTALREVLIADSSYKSQVKLNENFRARNIQDTRNCADV